MDGLRIDLVKVMRAVTRSSNGTTIRKRTICMCEELVGWSIDTAQLFAPYSSYV